MYLCTNFIVSEKKVTILILFPLVDCSALEYQNLFALLNFKKFTILSVGPDTQLVVSPIKNKIILGEVNILRFFETFISSNENLNAKIKNNEILDIAHRLNHASGKEVYVFVTKLSNLLGTNDSFTQKSIPSVVDVAVWSVLSRKTKLNALPSNLKKWASSNSKTLGKLLILEFQLFKLDWNHTGVTRTSLWRINSFFPSSIKHY